MTAPAFEAAVMQTFVCCRPTVVEGATWLSDARRVEACVRAGIVGSIGAGSFPAPVEPRAEIGRARAACSDLSFGVDVSMPPKRAEGKTAASIFQVLPGLRFFKISGRKPEGFLLHLQDTGIAVPHKVPSVRTATKARAMGIDMVLIVDGECGGRQRTCPRRHRRRRVACGTAALCFRPDWRHRGGEPERRRLGHGYGERRSWHAVPRGRGAPGLHDGAGQRHVARRAVRPCANAKIGIEALIPDVAGPADPAACRSGDIFRRMLPAGRSPGLTDRVAPLADIVAHLEAGADVALGPWRPAVSREPCREGAVAR